MVIHMMIHMVIHMVIHIHVITQRFLIPIVIDVDSHTHDDTHMVTHAKIVPSIDLPPLQKNSRKTLFPNLT
jgi:hypothetical protein